MHGQPKDKDQKFLGTHLTKLDYHKFSIIATRRGKSRSALLRALAMGVIERDDKRKTTSAA